LTDIVNQIFFWGEGERDGRGGGAQWSVLVDKIIIESLKFDGNIFD
jgi:hypothetical protein